ncbi:hypothetical protein ACSHT0_01150 [Tepidicaulis sp. LMO-SS28]|uniref:hypothetical protein n=1 Tax=Tepidicaulis sp. LMO-SS28 TaxID=3447455 RepID=UPI003EDF0037
MWAVVTMLVHFLSGPDSYVVTDAGTFETKEACESAIAAAVPSQLEGDALEQFKSGNRVYACVKVLGYE